MTSRQHFGRAPSWTSSATSGRATGLRKSTAGSTGKRNELRTKSTNSKVQQTLATASTTTNNRQKRPTVSPSRSNRTASLSEDEIEQLASRFEQLTSSVLNLASSPKPLGARSLEDLLTSEIADHLGPEVNSPRFSQRFIQATRGLLDNLVCLYEEGKLNPRLLRDQKTTRQTFLKAKSSANVCYRDKYLKELVMNVLKSMCSNDMEEEVSRASVHVSSAASRERVLAIRDIVRAEAGLEPETFRELDRKLAELRQSMSQNQLEMLRAAREVERVISDHLLSHGSSMDYVNIPGAAREALRQSSRANCVNTPGAAREALRQSSRANCVITPEAAREALRQSSRANCVNTPGAAREALRQSSRANCVNTPGAAREALRTNCVEAEERRVGGGEDETNSCGCPKNCLNSEQIIESQAFVPFSAQDPMESIKPYIQEIVQKELNRAKEKRSRLLNKGRFTVEIVSSKECANSVEDLDVEDDAEDDEDDDEINEEETRIFLEALKFDIEQRQANMAQDDSQCLEPIDEDEDEIVKGESNHIMSLEYENDLINSSGRSLDQCDDLYRAGFELESNKFDLSPNINCLEGVKSIPWPSGNVEENNIVRDMREVCEKLKYAPEHLLNSGLCVNRNEQALFGGNEPDFTIDKVEKILKNVALKIEQIPVFFQSPESSVSEERQQQLLKVLNVLGVDVRGAFLHEGGALQCLGRDERFLTSLLSASKSFSFMSKALHSTPDQVRDYPFSALVPPSSLTSTLVFLASSEHFKDCFTTVLDKETLLKLGFGCESEVRLQEPATSDNEQNVEVIHQRVADTTSSDAIPPTERGRAGSVHDGDDDIDKHISGFEHYLGLTPSVLTVQNVSDMFIYLSTVLNEVPERVRRERITSLNPPASFLRALAMLYGDDESRPDFNSLTIQDVSNFFLTLSKALQDTPGRVRHSSVLEMDPPKSLLKAINLLTSLAHISIPESHSEEEIGDVQRTRSHETFRSQDTDFEEKPNSLDQTCCKLETSSDQERPVSHSTINQEPSETQNTHDQERPQSSHEKFFDAVDSWSSLRPLSR